MEEAVGDSDANHAARAAAGRATGLKVSDIVLENLPAKAKKQGVKGAVYQKEQGFFDDVAERTFRTLGVSWAYDRPLSFSHIKGFRPEWCISTMTIVEIYHCGRKSSRCMYTTSVRQACIHRDEQVVEDDSIFTVDVQISSFSLF